jgi:guanine deaminase
MQALRSSILHCLVDPGAESRSDTFEYFDDGVLIIDNGSVVAAGDAASLLNQLPANTKVEDYRGKLIVPGLIDCHVHFPQLDIIGSFGAQLLDWLNQYAFPVEEKFADPEHAREVAGAFVDELLRKSTSY